MVYALDQSSCHKRPWTGTQVLETMIYIFRYGLQSDDDSIDDTGPDVDAAVDSLAQSLQQLDVKQPPSYRQLRCMICGIAMMRLCSVA